MVGLVIGVMLGMVILFLLFKAIQWLKNPPWFNIF